MLVLSFVFFLGSGNRRCTLQPARRRIRARAKAKQLDLKKCVHILDRVGSPPFTLRRKDTPLPCPGVTVATAGNTGFDDATGLWQLRTYTSAKHWACTGWGGVHVGVKGQLYLPVGSKGRTGGVRGGRAPLGKGLPKVSETLSAWDVHVREPPGRSPPVAASVVSLLRLVCLQQLVPFTKQMKTSF